MGWKMSRLEYLGWIVEWVIDLQSGQIGQWKAWMLIVDWNSTIVVFSLNLFDL